MTRKLRDCWLAAIILLSSFPTSIFAAPPKVTRLTHNRHFKQRPAWSPDGTTLSFSQHHGDQIQIAFLTDGNPSVRHWTSNVPQYDGIYSPDGKHIVYTRVNQTPGQGNLDVYIAAEDGSDSIKLAGDQGKLSHEEYPSWSPDGKRIVFTSTFEGNQEVYTINVNGSDRVRITSDPALDAHPAWAPDQRRIAFATNRWGDLEIAESDPDGQNLIRLTNSPRLDDYPVYSPDGKQIAFVSHREGNADVFILNRADRSVTNITENPAIDQYPTWSPDGDLTFISNRDEGFDIYRVDLKVPRLRSPVSD